MRRLLRGSIWDCVGNSSLGRPRKRWIDTIKDCLKKSDLDVRQARRIVQDRNAKRVYVGECAGSRGSDGLISRRR